MIRDTAIGSSRTAPRSPRLGRLNGRPLGVVNAGDGGSATNYTFDQSTGLSNDPSLAPYLQNLTFSQLQTALNGQSPNADLSSLLYQDLTATGAGSLPCGGTDNPTCGQPGGDGGGGLPSSSPWLWLGIAGVAILGLGVMKR
jgi:hypothetical protein